MQGLEMQQPHQRVCRQKMGFQISEIRVNEQVKDPLASHLQKQTKKKQVVFLVHTIFNQQQKEVKRLFCLL